MGISFHEITTVVLDLPKRLSVWIICLLCQVLRRIGGWATALNISLNDLERCSASLSITVALQCWGVRLHETWRVVSWRGIWVSMTFSNQGFVNATARQLEFRLISKQAEIQFEVLANSSFWASAVVQFGWAGSPIRQCLQTSWSFSGWVFGFLYQLIARTLNKVQTRNW